ncbi:hypothetical protein BU17DRAFT_101568 [Hysterangium stoloniferum]|nr:hypothetical protein BU17DRAFT_101568 [Hysterangium stoloniferum]
MEGIHAPTGGADQSRVHAQSGTNGHRTLRTGTARCERAQHVVNGHSTLRTGTAHCERAQHIANGHSTLRMGTARCERAQHVANRRSALRTGAARWEQAQHIANRRSALRTGAAHCEQVQHVANRRSALRTGAAHARVGKRNVLCRFVPEWAARHVPVDGNGCAVDGSGCAVDGSGCVVDGHAVDGCLDGCAVGYTHGRKERQIAKPSGDRHNMCVTVTQGSLRSQRQTVGNLRLASLAVTKQRPRTHRRELTYMTSLGTLATLRGGRFATGPTTSLRAPACWGASPPKPPRIDNF